MAPEQFRAEAADARTDQFSFCVSLYEALYGERPFAADSLAGLIEAVTPGGCASVPPRARVPAWLRKVVLRGLALKREDRFATMDDLLTALARDPERQRRRVLLGAGLAGAAARRWRVRPAPAAESRRGGVPEPGRQADRGLGVGRTRIRKRRIRAGTRSARPSSRPASGAPPTFGKGPPRSSTPMPGTGRRCTARPARRPRSAASSRRRCWTCGWIASAATATACAP